MPTDRPLNTHERNQLSTFIKTAMKHIGADRAASPHPDKLVELISEAIDLYRNLEADRRQEASVSLGTLWGQIICDQLGWTWVSLKLDTKTEVFGVVSPNRSHVIYPLHHVNALLFDTSTDQNSLTLYNSLKKGILPPGSDHSYVVIGSAANS
ncbi:MAG TPA: hypothetical protein VKX17_05040 [Planctomycetota bacterium]|nr:hypothetical protein [Planctomycetota bacterium]